MESLFHRAVARQRAGDFEEAVALYRQVTDFRPDWTQHNLGVIYRTTGRLDDAEAALRMAARIDPENPHIRHSLGMTLLQLGKYAEGWRYYEARLAINRNTPPPPLPQWRGESLAGRRLVVLAEQGLGDQILLSRFLGSTGADEVVFACPPELERLLSALPVEVLSPQRWSDVGGDCWTYLGSVPRWLEFGPADAPAPYLPCPVRAAPPSGVGLMLEARPDQPHNVHRLPPAAVARAIRGLGPFVDLSPQASGARDFAETAGIVAGLARVVTVDTSVAHLAGAMGKPCWVMMGAVASDWWTRWRDDGTPWYPSVRLIRQRQPGDWAGVIAEVAAVLAEG